MSHQRFFFIDALKAFAIVLVVMGHTVGLWEASVYELVLSPVLALLLCKAACSCPTCCIG